MKANSPKELLQAEVKRLKRNEKANTALIKEFEAAIKKL